MNIIPSCQRLIDVIHQCFIRHCFKIININSQSYCDTTVNPFCNSGVSILLSASKQATGVLTFEGGFW
jgi:hypothetical protein